MKRSIFQYVFRIAAIALFLKAAVVQAETFNCMSSSSSKMIELIMGDPVHPECPPAACQDGYSCQPDPEVPPPGECPDFLKEYVNIEEQSLPEDRVYPLGRKMMLTAWLAISAADLQEMADHGFTMQGPVWDTRDLAHINTAKAKGLRVAHKVNDGAGSVYKLLPKLDAGTEEKKLWR
ncbi:MAG TPA: hypothetical protein DCO79_00025, partial [Spirochaeta sp.]|nr:hypothetical protein [Spirochaeta sp.]